jgi:hypothetical protein
MMRASRKLCCRRIRATTATGTPTITGSHRWRGRGAFPRVGWMSMPLVGRGRPRTTRMARTMTRGMTSPTPLGNDG